MKENPRMYEIKGPTIKEIQKVRNLPFIAKSREANLKPIRRDR